MEDYADVDDGIGDEPHPDVEAELGDGAASAHVLAQGVARRRGRGSVTSGSFFFATPPEPVDVKALFPNSDHTAAPHVASVLAEVRLGANKKIDLVKFASAVRNVELHPKRKGAVMRLTDPKCVATVQLSGIVLITGCHSVPAAKRAATIVSKVIRRVMGWTPQQLPSVTLAIHSSSVRFDLKHPIRLELLAHEHPKECSYEPESFCGCTVRMSGVLPTNTTAISGNTLEGFASNSQLPLFLAGGDNLGATSAIDDSSGGGVISARQQRNSAGGAAAASSATQLTTEQQQRRWNVVATVFASGKVLLLGACDSNQVITAYNALLPILAKAAAPVQTKQQQQAQRQQQHLPSAVQDSIPNASWEEPF